MSAIGTAARQSGVTVETIRYYERTGLVPPAPRTRSGRRDYGPAEIGRLRMIRRCRDLGFPLGKVRALLDLAAAATTPCAEVKAIAENHLAEVRHKLKDLAELEQALAAMVDSCSGLGPTCPVLGKLAGDQAAPVSGTGRTASTPSQGRCPG